MTSCSKASVMAKHPLAQAISHTRRLGQKLALTGMLSATLLVLPAHANEARQFQLNPGSLGNTLTSFAAQSGAVIYFDAEVTRGLNTQGLNGSYTIEQALQSLLKGTSLQVVKEPDGSYRIVQQSSVGSDQEAEQSISDLSGITVYGRQSTDTVADIPQTVSVYNEDNFDIGDFDQTGDVLRLVPNAAPAGSSLDMFADNYLIRGFDAEHSVNGLGFSRKDHPSDMANVERLEVLKGPASVLYGQMEPGGTINIVTKQPLDYFQAEAGLEVGSDNYTRTTLDVTGPISNRVRARLNLAYQDSDSFVDNLENERLFIAPNVTIDLSEKTNLTVEGSYYQNEWTGLNGGTPIEGSVINNPNGDYSKGFNPSGSDAFTKRDSHDLNIRLTHELTDDINARASYTYTRNEADWEEQAPFGLGDDMRTLDRIVFAGTDTSKTEHNLILDLNGEFDTGDIGHKFIVGVDLRKGEAKRPTQIYFIDSIDIYTPEYSPINLAQSPQVRDRNTLQDDDVTAFFIQDRVSLNDSLHLLAGLRYIDSEQSQKSINYANSSESVDSIEQTDWTSQLGIMYDINANTSVYANHTESFVPQQGKSSGQKPLKAEEGLQHEIGFRTQMGKIQFNAAAFVITKDNMAIEDPLDDDFEVAEGKARSKGIELTLGGYINPNLYLSAAYGYTDTEILSTDDNDLKGNRLANVPKHTASLQSRYHISAVPGLSVGGVLAYMGERYGDDDNTFELPGFTRTDITVSYEINDALQAGLVVNNIFDENIYSPASFDGVVREPGRTLQASLKYNF